MKRLATKITGALVAGKIAGIMGEVAETGNSWASGFATGFLACMVTMFIVIKVLKAMKARKQKEAYAGV